MGQECGDFMSRVLAAFERAGEGKDVLLLEGGGSLREGYVMGLPTPHVAKTLESKVLAIVKFRGEIRLLDDALTAHFRLGESLAGIIINRVPADDADFVENIAKSYIERQGLPVLGILPEDRALAALTVDELNGVTENVIVGQPIQLGTGDVKLIAKPLN